MRLSHLPLRLTTGAFILNSGLLKRGLPAEAAAGMQGMAQGAFPKIGTVSPSTFGSALSSGEMALGAALLAPVVSPVAAGAALTAFSAGLLRMWWVTPGMHEEGSPRPTQDGTAIAKDIWMLGAGLALMIGGVADARSGRARRRSKAAEAKAKAKAKARTARTASTKTGSAGLAKVRRSVTS